jgi:hypothetical protein
LDLIDLVMVVAFATYTGFVIPGLVIPRVRGRPVPLAGVLLVSAPTIFLVGLLVRRPR